MTTLAVIGDVHARYGYLEPVLEHIDSQQVDGILLVGDLGSTSLSLQRKRTSARDARYFDSVHTVLEMVRKLSKPTLFVPGNHDLPDLDLPENVDQKQSHIADLSISGIGGAGPERFGFCYEWDEDTIRNRNIPPADVLLCHCPPINTPLDLVPKRNQHVGSAAIRELAESQKGFLVCGHIHESPGCILINNCLCLNAGGLGRPFGSPQIGYLDRTETLDQIRHIDLGTGIIQQLEKMRPYQ